MPHYFGIIQRFCLCVRDFWEVLCELDFIFSSQVFALSFSVESNRIVIYVSKYIILQCSRLILCAIPFSNRSVSITHKLS